MSKARWSGYNSKIMVFRNVVTAVLWGSFMVFAVVAWSQTELLSAGVKTADAIKGGSLAQGAILLSGLCVGALAYGLRLAYYLHQEQVRSSIDTASNLQKLTDELKRLNDELHRRPCVYVNDNR